MAGMRERYDSLKRERLSREEPSSTTPTTPTMPTIQPTILLGNSGTNPNSVPRSPTSSRSSSRSKSDSVAREEKLRSRIQDLKKKIESLEQNSLGLDAARGMLAGLEQQLVSLTTKVEYNERALAEIERRKMEAEDRLNTGPSTGILKETLNIEIRETEKVMLGVDVCFLVDCTGSMTQFIKAVKERIGEIVVEVSSIQPARKPHLQFAFVGYKDHCDGDNRLVAVDFLELVEDYSSPASLAAVSEFKDKIKGIVASGGGDDPEDIAGGLNKVAELNWKSSTKLIVHFADAPCHGTKYHSLKDDYPNGDPNNLQPEDLLRRLMAKRIDYYFMKIKNATDKMVEIFKEVYSHGRAEFRVVQVDTAAKDFVPQVVKSITNSMIRTEMYAV